MKKKKNTNALFYHDHKPVTRRDFLGLGLLGTSTLLSLPSLSSLLWSREVYGQACDFPSAGGMTPFIVLDLAGGANFAGSNVMVGGAGGQMDYLPSYRNLGLKDSERPQTLGVDNTLGLAFHPTSPILQGIRNGLNNNAGALSRIEGCVFCTASNDDTQNNQHNPMYWINAAGANGSLTSLVGTRDSDSGGRSMAPAMSINPANRPVRVNRPQDAVALAEFGKLVTLLGDDKASKVMKAINDLSEAKLAKFNSQTLPQQIRELVQCGYIKSSDLINQFNPSNLDPENDTAIMQAFPNMNDGDQRKAATVAKLVLDGYAGAGTIEKGGYDYHNGTRVTGDSKDQEAGELIGRLFRAAQLKNSDLVIYVLTDGGVASNGQEDGNNGRLIWSGDSGQRSSTFMLVYKRDGRPEMRGTNRQIGHFKSNISGAGTPNGASVETGAGQTSDNIINLAKAVTANYLALHGNEGQLESVVGDNPFGMNLDNYLAFQKLR